MDRGGVRFGSGLRPVEVRSSQSWIGDGSELGLVCVRLRSGQVRGGAWPARGQVKFKLELDWGQVKFGSDLRQVRVRVRPRSGGSDQVRVRLRSG